jgi:hypothetical protein
VKRALAVMCACLPLTPAACSSAPKPTQQPTPTAGLEILSTVPASGSVHASDIYPLGPGERRFATADGNLIVVRIKPTSEHRATFAMAEGVVRTTWLRTNDDGCIAMTAVLEADDHAVSLFTPPLVVAF